MIDPSLETLNAQRRKTGYPELPGGWLDRHPFAAGMLAILGWLLIVAIWAPLVWLFLQGPS